MFVLGYGWTARCSILVERDEGFRFVVVVRIRSELLGEGFS